MSTEHSGCVGEQVGAGERVLETRLRVPVEQVDLASDRLWVAGAQAVEEVAIDGATVELRTVLCATPSASRARLGKLPHDWRLGFETRALAPAQTWRAFATPMRVSEQLTVVPAWLAALDDDGDDDGSNTVIRIEPGAAFGLGDHPTTHLMLAAIDRRSSGCNSITGRTVLDVGTGTGVLAILAAMRGAVDVTAVDVAPAAVEATRSNATLNAVSVSVSLNPVAQIDRTYDLVLANILAPVLVAMADDLRRVTAPAGELIVSGVLDGGFEHVVQAMEPMVVTSVDTLDGWAAIGFAHRRVEP